VRAAAGRAHSTSRSRGGHGCAGANHRGESAQGRGVSPGLQPSQGERCRWRKLWAAQLAVGEMAFRQSSNDALARAGEALRTLHVRGKEQRKANQVLVVPSADSPRSQDPCDWSRELSTWNGTTHLGSIDSSCVRSCEPDSPAATPSRPSIPHRHTRFAPRERETSVQPGLCRVIRGSRL